MSSDDLKNHPIFNLTYNNWINEDGKWVDDLTSNLPPAIPCPDDWLNSNDTIRDSDFPVINQVIQDDISDTEDIDEDPLCLHCGECHYYDMFTLYGCRH